MKLLLISLLTAIFLNADDLNSVNEMIHHISELKSSNSRCQNDLDKYKNLLEDEQKKNQQLLVKVQDYNKSVERLLSEIEENKKMLLKVQQQNREEKEKQLKVQEQKIQKIKQEQKIVERSKKVKKEQGYKIVTFKPSSFRLKQNSDIYDSIDGKKVDRWVKDRSFTSNIKSDNWMKITGYFINKKWQKSQNELWVKLDKVLKRD